MDPIDYLNHLKRKKSMLKGIANRPGNALTKGAHLRATIGEGIVSNDIGVRKQLPKKLMDEHFPSKVYPTCH